MCFHSWSSVDRSPPPSTIPREYFRMFTTFANSHVNFKKCCTMERQTGIQKMNWECLPHVRSCSTQINKDIEMDVNLMGARISCSSLNVAHFGRSDCIYFAELVLLVAYIYRLQQPGICQLIELFHLHLFRARQPVHAFDPRNQYIGIYTTEQ